MENAEAAVKNPRGRTRKPMISLCLDRLEEVLGKRHLGKIGVIKLYLENFRAYNDSFGYDFGGILIDQVTAYLESLGEAEVYHIRGVEYILITKPTSRQAIGRLLESVLQRFDDTWEVYNLICTCSVNAGVVYLPGYADTSNDILEKLGQAINESMQLGQNQYVEYDADLRDKYYRRSVIAQLIPKMIQSEKLELRYWPIYQVSKERFTRIDCSMLMYSEEFGFIQEDELMSVAEQSGQVYALSQYAISRVCALIAELLSRGKDFEAVAVRLSPMQFLQERFASDMAREIAAAGIPPGCLAFEVNDSTVHNMFARAHLCMSELADMGVEMVLAGFGTGALGVNSIMSMSVNVVKIMRMLVWQIDNSPVGAALVDGLIYLCKNVGLKLVAEGVETDEQVRALTASGCDYLKGLYYTRSLSAEQLAEILSDI